MCRHRSFLERTSRQDGKQEQISTLNRKIEEHQTHLARVNDELQILTGAVAADSDIWWEPCSRHEERAAALGDVERNSASSEHACGKQAIT